MGNVHLIDDVISVEGYKLKISKIGAAFHLAETGLKKLHSVWSEDLSLLTVTLPNNNKIVVVPHEEGMMILDAEILKKA